MIYNNDIKWRRTAIIVSINRGYCSECTCPLKTRSLETVDDFLSFLNTGLWLTFPPRSCSFTFVRWKHICFILHGIVFLLIFSRLSPFTIFYCPICFPSFVSLLGNQGKTVVFWAPLYRQTFVNYSAHKWDKVGPQQQRRVHASVLTQQWIHPMQSTSCEARKNRGTQVQRQQIVV